MSTTPEREVRMVWKGVTAAFMQDTTRHVDFEGAFRVGKTTAALWKVFNLCLEHPGIHCLICRYSDGDTQTKLKPPWRAICQTAGVSVHWDSTELCDVFPNGSKVYIFGIKAQDQTSRYGKFRGMTLAVIYNDQTEELPHDVFLEMIGRLSQSGFPHQLLLTPNPPDENHWLAREFPENNPYKDRKYYSAPIYANSHNLPPETIPALERAYPPSHPKHRSAVLGKRGLNVIGKPVYGGDPERDLAPMFNRALHVQPLTYNPKLPLLEGIDFGRHHPCIVWAQYTPYGQVHYLGGLMGQDLFLEDFLPVAKQYRAQWFPTRAYELTCCDPAGSHEGSGLRRNAIEVLKEAGFVPTFKDNSNSPDVRVAMVERIGGYMRRRTPQGEAFGLERDPDKWLLVTSTEVRPWHFLSDGFEAGYVWDENMVSVGSKKMRRPKNDGWYDHGQHCCEYMEINFGGAQPSVAATERHAERLSRQAVVRAQRDVDAYDWRLRQKRHGRGGY
jgi:hypothetical protein